MRLTAFIEYAAVIIGIIAVVAGQFFAIPKGIHLGVFMMGAGVALGGIEGIVTRRLCFRFADDAYDGYEGVPAMIIGMMALLIGAAVIATAYLLADGKWHATVDYLTRRPAPMLIGAGLLLSGLGVVMMFNTQGRRGLAWTLLVHLPKALAGLVLVVGGFTGAGIGAWGWLDPPGFERLVETLPQKLDWPL